MALYEYVGRAADSIDFLSDRLVRLVKTMVEVAPPESHHKTCDLPDLLKDICQSKMTRCEMHLASKADGSNPSANVFDTDSVTMQQPPLPCEDTDAALPHNPTGYLAPQKRLTNKNHVTNKSPDIGRLQEAPSHQAEGHDIAHPLHLRRRETVPAIPASDLPIHEDPNDYNAKRKASLKFHDDLLSLLKIKSSTTDGHNPSDSSVDHGEGENHSQMTREFVLALRSVGDKLDRKIDHKAKRNMLQQCICTCLHDLSGSVVTEILRKKRFEAALNVWAFLGEYSRF